MLVSLWMERKNNKNRKQKNLIKKQKIKKNKTILDLTQIRTRDGPVHCLNLNHWATAPHYNRFSQKAFMQIEKWTYVKQRSFI